MIKTPTVRSVMRKRNRTFNVDFPMPEAAGIIARSPVAAIPVVDARGEVVGLLSEKDCLRAVSRWAYEGISGGVVADFMSEISVHLTPEMDLLSAASGFIECNFACLPVMDGDQLVGRLVRHELFTAIESWAADINRALAQRATAAPGHERPSAIPHMLKVVGSHTRQQISQVFKKN